MGDQEERERGIRDGQKADLGDQFCHGLSRAFNNPSYNGGFDEGVDSKPSSNGSDPGSNSNSGSSGRDSFLGSSSDSGSGESSSDDDSDLSSNPPSGEGGGGGGGYGGGSSGCGNRTETGVGGLAALATIGVIGALVYFGLFGNSNPSNKAPKPQPSNPHKMVTVEDYRKMSPQEKSRRAREYRQELKQGLEEHVKVLAQYLKQTGKIEGDIDSYQFITPPTSVMSGSSDYQVAVVNENYFRIYKSHDMGKTWVPISGNFANPFLREIDREIHYSAATKGGVSPSWLNGLKSRSKNPYYMAPAR